jgi:hypothetical protein
MYMGGDSTARSSVAYSESATGRYSAVMQSLQIHKYVLCS